MRAVAWVGAGLLFALGALAALTADTRDEGTAFALGAVFGRASITLLIALALRAGYLWIRRPGGAGSALVALGAGHSWGDRARRGPRGRERAR